MGKKRKHQSEPPVPKQKSKNPPKKRKLTKKQQLKEQPKAQPKATYANEEEPTFIGEDTEIFETPAASFLLNLDIAGING